MSGLEDPANRLDDSGRKTGEKHGFWERWTVKKITEHRPRPR
jgi:hypothetical protein